MRTKNRGGRDERYAVCIVAKHTLSLLAYLLDALRAPVVQQRRLETKMKTYIALDSGAFSQYRKMVLGGGEKKNPKIKNSARSVSTKIASRTRRGDDYYGSDVYQDYLDAYVEYVKEHKKKFEYYVTLDAMYDAERTYQATRQLEKAGLHPMPVFHYGEDFKWLKKYMDSYKYIGIGGIARGVGGPRRVAFLNKVFAITHPKGKDEFKLHGFGLTSTELMLMYPWYSVDSFSPLMLANNGKLQMPEPIIKRGSITGFDFTKSGRIVYISQRLRARKNNAIDHSPGRYLEAYKDYIRSMGLKPEDMYSDGTSNHSDVGAAWRSSLPPEKKSSGNLGTARSARSFANLYTYAKTAEALSDLRGSPLRMYFSGSINGKDMDEWMKLAHKNDFREFCWLGTFFDTGTLTAFMAPERKWYMGHEFDRPRRPRFTTEQQAERA